MEKFVKEWNLDSLPPPPPLSAPYPDESESDDRAAQLTEKGDTIAVRGSNERGWFRVAGSRIDRCYPFDAISICVMSAIGKNIPRKPFDLGAYETKLHAKPR